MRRSVGLEKGLLLASENVSGGYYDQFCLQGEVVHYVGGEGQDGGESRCCVVSRTLSSIRAELQGMGSNVKEQIEEAARDL